MCFLLLRYPVQEIMLVSTKPINTPLYLISYNTRFLAYLNRLDPPINQLGISLSTLFLRCVSHAAFANDICGQPLPPSYVNPWNFFDGKLFQFKLSIMSRSGATIYDLCDDNDKNAIEIVHTIDSLRAAILHNTPLVCNSRKMLWQQQQQKNYSALLFTYNIYRLNDFLFLVNCLNICVQGNRCK